MSIHVYPAEAWIWPNKIDQIEDGVPGVAGIISDTEREREQNSESVKGNCLERCSDIDIVARRSMTCYDISAC